MRYKIVTEVGLLDDREMYSLLNCFDATKYINDTC